MGYEPPVDTAAELRRAEMEVLYPPTPTMFLHILQPPHQPCFLTPHRHPPTFPVPQAASSACETSRGGEREDSDLAPHPRLSRAATVAAAAAQRGRPGGRGNRRLPAGLEDEEVARAGPDRPGMDPRTLLEERRREMQALRREMDERDGRAPPEPAGPAGPTDGPKEL